MRQVAEARKKVPAEKPKAQAKAPERVQEKQKAKKAVSSYRKLLRFGKIFEVDKDEDYKAAAMTYAEEADLIAKMRTQLAEDGMTVAKEYVKGRQNVCVHPLVTEIPKHVDCANRTLGILGDIIVKRGRKKAEEIDGLSEFRL